MPSCKLPPCEELSKLGARKICHWQAYGSFEALQYMSPPACIASFTHWCVQDKLKFNLQWEVFGQRGKRLWKEGFSPHLWVWLTGVLQSWLSGGTDICTCLVETSNQSQGFSMKDAHPVLSPPISLNAGCDSTSSVKNPANCNSKDWVYVSNLQRGFLSSSISLPSMLFILSMQALNCMFGNSDSWGDAPCCCKRVTWMFELRSYSRWSSVLQDTAECHSDPLMCGIGAFC